MNPTLWLGQFRLLAILAGPLLGILVFTIVPDSTFATRPAAFGRGQ